MGTTTSGKKKVAVKVPIEIKRVIRVLQDALKRDAWSVLKVWCPTDSKGKYVRIPASDQKRWHITGGWLVGEILNALCPGWWLTARIADDGKSIKRFHAVHGTKRTGLDCIYPKCEEAGPIHVVVPSAKGKRGTA